MTDDLDITTKLNDLVETAADIVENTKSTATKRAYQTDFRLFNEWCESMGLESLPAEPKTVMLYMVHMFNEHKKVSTIRRSVTSIAQAHKLSGLKTPVTDQVLEIQKGINRKIGVAPKKVTPITLGKLRRIIAKTPSDFLGKRDKAILLVGWTCALRRSEICDIDLEDLTDDENGFVLNLKKSKTDQEKLGRKIGIPFVDNEKFLCAPRHLRRWIDLARIKSGPVFRSVGRSGRRKLFGEVGNRLTPRSISNVIKFAVKRAGYDPFLYSGHSLRSGLATTLAESGIDERRIMSITGHRSVKMLREYIHEGELFADHPIRELFELMALKKATSTF